MPHWRIARLAVIFVLLALAAGGRAASRYSVTLDPPGFGVDEASELTITVTGDEDAAPIIPHVPGLVINPDGQSSSIQQVNGAVTAIFSRTYRVTADQEGTYTIRRSRSELQVRSDDGSCGCRGKRAPRASER